MPQIPPRPIPGRPIESEWFPRFWDFVKSLTPTGDLRTVAVRHTDRGVSISALEYLPFRRQTGGGGSGMSIAKVTVRTAARTYAIDLYSRWESNWTLNTTYRTAVGETMQTPGLDDTAVADRLAVGTILMVTQANIAGTTVYVPVEKIGLF